MSMSVRLRNTVLVAIALTAPAAAKIVEVAGVPATPGFNLFRSDTALDGATKLTAPPPVALKAGSIALVFEGTPLADIAKELGGTIQHAGDAADSTYWLCYQQPGSATAPAAVVWFQSGELGGEAHTLAAIAVETAPAAMPAECIKPKKSINLETGMPGLGAKTADLVTAFGAATPKADGVVVYTHEGAIADGPLKGGVTLTFLGYKLEGDLVAAYQIGQISSN